MTHNDANALLDETFGGEDGASPIRFGSPRDADQVLGHLQHYRTREGRRIRLARYRDETPFVAPEPYVHDWRGTVREIVLPFLVLALCCAAAWLYFAIASASQMPVPA